MLETHSKATLYRERIQRQQQSIRRKRREILRWLAALLFIGTGASGLVSLLFLFGSVPKDASLLLVWVAGLVGAFAGGGLAFYLLVHRYFCRPLLTLFMEGVNGAESDVPDPMKLAYGLGIFLAMLGSSLSGSQFGLRGGGTAWAGALLGYLMWKVVFRRSRSAAKRTPQAS